MFAKLHQVLYNVSLQSFFQNGMIEGERSSAFKILKCILLYFTYETCQKTFEGIGIIKPVIAANPYGTNAILEVDEYPYGTPSPIGTPPTPIVTDPSPIVADPFRAKRGLLPVYPVVSNTKETPEAEPPTWEEKNRGRLNVFKSMGNKSRSCRW